MSLIDKIDDIFFDVEDPPTDYVACRDLSQIPRTVAVWRTHRNEYVEYASRLALCVHFSNLGLRKCSSLLHGAYRRLENYAEYTGIVDYMDSVLKGFGKLVEFQVSFDYSPQNPKHKEVNGKISFYIAIPIHLEPAEAAAIIGEDLILDIAYRILERILLGGGFADYTEFKYEGAREIDINIARNEIPVRYRPFTVKARFLPIADSWCNRITRASFDSAYFHYEDNRGHEYYPEHTSILAEPEEVLELVKPAYDAIVDALRYW